MRRLVGWGLAWLAAVAAASCAVTTVEVDVYKGPMANHCAVQLEQIAGMALGAKPLIVQLRDQLESERRMQIQKSYNWEAVPKERRTFQADLRHESDYYKPGYINIDAVRKDKHQFWSEDAALLNAILNLYEDQETPSSEMVELSAEIQDYAQKVQTLSDIYLEQIQRAEELLFTMCDRTLEYGEVDAVLEEVHGILEAAKPMAAELQADIRAFDLLCLEALRKGNPAKPSERTFMRACALVVSFVTDWSDALNALGADRRLADPSSAQGELLLGELHADQAQRNAVFHAISANPADAAKSLTEAISRGRFSHEAVPSGEELGSQSEESTGGQGSPRIVNFYGPEYESEGTPIAVFLEQLISSMQVMVTFRQSVNGLHNFLGTDASESVITVSCKGLPQKATGKKFSDFLSQLPLLKPSLGSLGGALGLGGGRLDDGLDKLVTAHLDDTLAKDASVSCRCGISMGPSTRRMLISLLQFGEKVRFVANYATIDSGRLASKRQSMLTLQALGNTLLSSVDEYWQQHAALERDRDRVEIHQKAYASAKQLVDAGRTTARNRLSEGLAGVSKILAADRKPVSFARGMQDVASEYLALLARLAESPPPPFDLDLKDPDLEATSPRELLDAMITTMQYEIALELRQGGSTVRIERLRAAIAELNEQRAGLAYLRPASAYLRSASPATGLLSRNRDWDNLLFESGLRGIAGLDEFMDDLDGKTDAEIVASLDRTFWEPINSVRVSAVGDTNFALIKDDIGNWYIKGYSNSVKEIANSMRQLALFNASLPIGGDLEVAKQLGENLLNDPDNNDPDNGGPDGNQPAGGGNEPGPASTASTPSKDLGQALEEVLARHSLAAYVDLVQLAKSSTSRLATEDSFSTLGVESVDPNGGPDGDAWLEAAKLSATPSLDELLDKWSAATDADGRRAVLAEHDPASLARAGLRHSRRLLDGVEASKGEPKSGETSTNGGQLQGGENGEAGSTLTVENPETANSPDNENEESAGQGGTEAEGGAVAEVPVAAAASKAPEVLQGPDLAALKQKARTSIRNELTAPLEARVASLLEGTRAQVQVFEVLQGSLSD